MLLTAIVLQASTAGFAPPLDAPIRVVTERREDARIYRMERDVRFTREGMGYRAEVVLRAGTGETADSTGAAYEAGFGALAGSTLVFHLDPRGAIVAIDDMPALWDRFCRRVAEAAAARRTLAPAEREKLAARIAAPLRALPIERQRAMLASLVVALIADEAMTPGSTPVRLPGQSAYGGTIPLEGQRTVAALPGGLFRSTVRADAPDVTLERVTDMDPRTGLITRNRKTLRIRAGGLEKVSVTLLTVDPASE
ncbi:hypothetical protein OMP43_06660 [Sphingomonas sp. CBMAI 2297]|uniref:hypothetical protein n=1 Tax=Sphingomonas sp. CBMAI 2297 TaxID=2991720 RepID=UPI0024542509|nr:hypothetical protein [Sphingomonas sp. CBMAI 2297]MDH4743695.1 hypothetical protein [Sphingomonas sp. CBMAI 2297]